VAINYNKINKYFFNKSDQVSVYKDQLFSLQEPEKLLFNKFINKESKVLDIGCGAGRTTFHINKITTNVIGADYAENMIHAAREKHNSIDFRVMDATKLTFPHNFFDIVVFSYNGICCIHPEEKRIAAVLEIRRVLKKNGIFIYSVINKYPPYSISTLLNYIVSVPLLGFSTDYKIHVTRTGIALYYENTPQKEMQMMQSKGFKMLDKLNSDSVVRSKPVWTYYAFQTL